MSLARFEHGAVCAELHENVVLIARRMRDLHVGCVVVTRDAHPIGIVTDRDLVVRVLAEGRSPNETCVADVVTYDATTLETDATLETAARTMREHGVRRLPIVNDDGRITGVVTADDLVTLLSRELSDVSQGISDNVDATESR
jgi:CBS domain-containing protein